MQQSDEQTAVQLRCPHGEEGTMFGQVMNLRNLTQTVSAFHAVALNDSDCILEIGCGNGGLLSYILSLTDNMHYTGLEISPLMQQQAQTFNAPFIAAQQAEYVLYDGGLLLFGDQAFDKVVSVNTVYFWQNAPQMLSEICRVLKPAGRLCLNFCEKDFMTQLPFAQYGFTLYDASEIKQMTQQMPLYCVTEQRSRDWAVSKTGALIRREFVNLVFEKQKAV
ncbi:MAG: class I SAM-dependent methyltransferase [Neisseria sp.]|uniref:class I SAM-dependent methyltransferase n=1 Tax=Neisseria sp. TaxID=192066 RepID=UPI0026DAC161|nr:class I SAM-dependent methyltransferase [Neisseria sp.]MDO4640356.1 class I SAM-dependent methyltransferase [Neisseria sp.]